MDRTTVRIILAIIGVIVVIGVYLWHRYQTQITAGWKKLAGSLGDAVAQRQARKKAEGLHRSTAQDAADAADADTSFDDYLDDYALSPAREQRIEPYWRDDEPDDEFMDEAPRPRAAAAPPPPSPKTERPAVPNVVQLSVVAVDNAYFTGGEILDAFNRVGLRYGDMGIFHLYNEVDEILFSVASMVEPGTFPMENMMSFECPGVVLFFQPSHVDEPLDVFDSLVSCCHELAIRLNGVEWDVNRQPLTTEKIIELRRAL
ncbi:MAG: hypothetical protein EPN21_01385 [Methylococcaceae bacterium]|nr:MAG: hypothetical protein EPN21_01385 [Methylococcaceae bacterium]